MSALCLYRGRSVKGFLGVSARIVGDPCPGSHSGAHPGAVSWIGTGPRIEDRSPCLAILKFKFNFNS